MLFTIDSRPAKRKDLKSSPPKPSKMVPVSKPGPTVYSCNSCSYTCKSKPTIANHKKKMHGSVTLAMKKVNTKKRLVVHFNCEECHSTFDNKQKLKKHTTEQHKVAEEDEGAPSPPRKVLRGQDLDQRIEVDTEFPKTVEEAKEEDGIVETYDDIEEDNETVHVMNRPPPENEPDQIDIMTTVAKELQAQLDGKTKLLENQNKWIELQSRRAQTLEKEMVEISKENKRLKEEAIRTNGIVQHLNTKVQSMQLKVQESVANGEPHGETQGQANQEERDEAGEEVRQEAREARQEEDGQEVRGVGPIWRPPGHPPIQVDECVENVRCEGNCEHIEHKAGLEVTCYDCKNKFKDKIAMMDHKRDSDHPTKRKCNQYPDCERGVRCWYRHIEQVSPQVAQRAESQATSFTCKDCEQVFNNKNELMFHKKRAHPSNIMCTNFLNGYCRRGDTGEHCWYRHDQLHTAAPSVVRPQASLPPPGSTSWNLGFPIRPTMGQSPMVGLQQQMVVILEQQRQQQQQQQQQHQQQVNMIMSKLMNLNM